LKGLSVNIKSSQKILFLLVIIIISGCVAVQEMMKTSKPTVNVENVRLVNLSFSDVDLAFDIKVKNNNPFGINIAGLDYDLKINDASFLKGNNEDRLAIAASAESMVQIPLSLNFKNLYDTFSALANQDSSNYELQTTLYFDLPIIGRTPIAISKSGHVPLVKLPSIQIASLKLKKIALTNANLELKLDVVNPNAFSLLLNRLTYDFSINGMNWARGVTEKQMNVNQKGLSSLTIPINLDIMKMGTTVYQLLQGNKELNYQFNSDLDLNTSIALLKQVKIPMNKTGKINLSK